MRVPPGVSSIFRLLLLVLFSAASASAADFKVKVVDPQSAAVAGAEVSLLGIGGKVVSRQTTSAEGIAALRKRGDGSYQINVRAPGFAQLTVRLHLATASETVVVSATRTPVPGEAAGADVDTLSGAQITTMHATAANDAVRFLPGAVVNTAGQRGGLASLFVRGGESNYNKTIVDGVTINEPGGTFDFGTLSLAQGNRVEFVRGAQSTLYGSDAITSVVQVWTRSGNTPTPELRFGADGGNFDTANGYASLAGARGRFDYNLFGDQYNTSGSGVNDAYSNSLEGANVGAAINDRSSLRVRVRHSNSHTGLPGEWNFNGYVPQVPANGPTEPPVPLLPDPSAWSQLNSLLGSVELSVAAPSGWQHHFSGFDYLYRYNELNVNGDPLRVDSVGDPIDFPSHEVDRINRVGFEYQGDYSESGWTHTTFGYRAENENGFVGDVNFGQTHGQRLNHDAYVQQQVTLGTISAIGGGRFVHDSAFGNTGVPRVALNLQAFEAASFLLARGFGSRMRQDSRSRAWRRHSPDLRSRRRTPGSSRNDPARLRQRYCRVFLAARWRWTRRTSIICSTIRLTM